jgi:molybdenum cofactor synthesis domain-containing protein
VRVGILTVSTSRAAGTGDDASGERLEQFARELGGEIAAREIVTDERDAIAERLRRFSDTDGCALVLTTGGTGVAPRDVTPEATRDVLDREAPGIAQALRADSIAKTPHGLLSRGVAGVVGRALVVNLPGSTGGCRDGYAVLRPALGHAVALLGDETTRHRQTSG